MYIDRNSSLVSYANSARNVQNEPVNNNSSCSTSEIIDNRNTTAERPNYLSLNLDSKEEKVDIADTPIIYDEEQLNVCGSPIVEEL